MTNILILPAFDGSATEFVVTNNSDWYDAIFFPAMGSPPSVTLSGSTVETSNALTVSSTAALATGMPISPSPGIPNGAFIDAIISATQVTMRDFEGYVLYCTATDNKIGITFQQVPMDLTDIEFVANIRLKAGGPESFMTIQTSDGSFNNGGPSGTLAFAISADIEASPSMTRLQPGSYVMDIVAIADGVTINLFPEGPATVTVLDGVTDPTT